VGNRYQKSYKRPRNIHSHIRCDTAPQRSLRSQIMAPPNHSYFTRICGRCPNFASVAVLYHYHTSDTCCHLPIVFLSGRVHFRRVLYKLHYTPLSLSLEGVIRVKLEDTSVPSRGKRVGYILAQIFKWSGTTWVFTAYFDHILNSQKDNLKKKNYAYLHLPFPFWRSLGLHISWRVGPRPSSS